MRRRRCWRGYAQLVGVFNVARRLALCRDVARVAGSRSCACRTASSSRARSWPSGCDSYFRSDRSVLINGPLALDPGLASRRVRWCRPVDQPPSSPRTGYASAPKLNVRAALVQPPRLVPLCAHHFDGPRSFGHWWRESMTLPRSCTPWRSCVDDLGVQQRPRARSAAPVSRPRRTPCLVYFLHRRSRPIQPIANRRPLLIFAMTRFTSGR